MPTVNAPPPVSDAQVVKTFAFPFQLGKEGFPALADPDAALFCSIVALMLTGTNERLMHADMGVNIHRLIFNNMTPLLQARVASEVTQAIETFVPQAEVLAVDSRLSEKADGVETAIIVDVLYRRVGQPQTQQTQVTLPLAGG
ncbi:MAG: GPW/gp25 family protein [bacterium]